MDLASGDADAFGIDVLLLAATLSPFIASRVDTLLLAPCNSSAIGVDALLLTSGHACTAKVDGSFWIPSRNAGTIRIDALLLASSKSNAIHIEEWKKSVKPLLTYFLERTPGAEIEERHCSLRFHYRNAEDMETASRQASACASQINDAYESQHVHAVSADHSVIVEPTEYNAVNAAQKVFDDLKARLRAGSHETLVDFLMVLGGGRHDEKVFKWANSFQRCDGVGSIVTVSVSNRYTEAKTTLARGVSGALSCLQRLASAPWD
ncbi:hypothetical protein PLICBS_010171 [Purpureocillium lilacinum]|uniref:uncharacterized protein n=1 Tax=Purpureocillium lilacinum TaxID=33203 RepID=UPI002085EC4E|nr:hypothetical protein PLICBS_010171 [Purpureocillium lilacinum]